MRAAEPEVAGRGDWELAQVEEKRARRMNLSFMVADVSAVMRIKYQE